MIISVGLLPDGTIPNGNPFQNVPVETLVSLCLVLRLNEDEAADYLARCERAFSPAKPVHQCYLELIRLYSQAEQN